MSPAGLLLPLEITKAIWDDIFMDFMEGLPKVSGYDTILVVVDRLSKYGHFVALKRPFWTKSVVDVFVKEVFGLHGYPKSIVLDRDKVFMSHLWQEMFCAASTRLNHNSTYHLQSDSQIEVVNRCLESYLH